MDYNDKTEILAKLENLERKIQLLEENMDRRMRVIEARYLKNARRKRDNSFVDIVRKSITALDKKTFTTQEVKDMIEHLHPGLLASKKRGALPETFKQMRKQGEFVLLSREKYGATYLVSNLWDPSADEKTT